MFYRDFEVVGVENLPTDGPVLLCANHVNALVDALVVQAACPRPVHPLARSGLFRSPWLRPVLAAIQAVPVRRRRPEDAVQGQGDGAPGGTDPGRNDATFERCFEFLGEGRVLLIFPEGQSHSDPTLRPLKTGAARLALGHLERRGSYPTIVPVGLTFTHKGRFRSRVLVQIGKPAEADPPKAGEEVRATVGRLTEAVTQGLYTVTLNVESWQDLALLEHIRAFAALRERRVGRKREKSLHHRFRALQTLVDTHRWLRLRMPEQVASLRAKLERFERLSDRYGVQDYHLSLRYRPLLVARFVLRSLTFLLIVAPIAAIGLLQSGPAYAAARVASRRSAKGRDQYDTASMVFGLFFFGLFWGAQLAFVFWRWGTVPALGYAAVLPLTAGIALWVGRERRRIAENVRVFFLFLRKQKIRDYLRQKRRELETELARLAKAAKPELGGRRGDP